MSNTIADKLELAANNKTAIKAAIEAKSPSVMPTDVMSQWPESIASINGSSYSNAKYEEVCTKVNFCKSKLIEEGGKGSYAGAWICLRNDTIDYEDFTLASSGLLAIKTSDGHTYTYSSQGANVSHTWDRTQDFTIEGLGSTKYRWVIYYYDGTIINTNVAGLDCAKVCNQIYVFDMDLKYYMLSEGSYRNTYGLTRYNTVVESFDFINNHRCYERTTGDWQYFMRNCTSLIKLPDNLDTSTGTNFNSFLAECNALVKLPDNLDLSNATNLEMFCASCYSLKYLPENLNTLNATSFKQFCNSCRSLEKLPDNLKTTNCTNFDNFCNACYALKKLPYTLNTGKGTNFNAFCANCFALELFPMRTNLASGTNFTSFLTNDNAVKTLNVVLPKNYNMSFNTSNNLTVETMKYISDNAPTVSSKTLTLGSINIARANKYDSTIIQNLNSKGWTVN